MGAGGTPANEVLTTIGTAKDHTDIVTWEAATDEDCTAGWGAGIYADPCSPVGKVYDTGDFTDNLTIVGATTDSTHYRRVTVAVGHRHSSGGIAYPKNDAGAKNTGFVAITEDYAEVEWLIVDSNNESGYAQVDLNGGQDVLLRNMIADAGSGQYIAFRLDPGNGKNPVAENCIGITRRNHVSATPFAGGFQDGVKCRNCTGWTRGGDSTDEAFVCAATTNCIGIGAGSVNGVYSTCTGDYNVGSDATAPGGNSDQYDNTSAADLFEDLTDGAEDLHLKAAADGNFEGTDLSAHFTDDIDADTRSDWDIGADEHAGGSVELVVADSESVVESENIGLTQHQALSIDDSGCVVESEQPAFTQHQALAVDDSACVAESEAAVLTQHQVLAVGDSESVVESEEVALTQHQVLAVVIAECIVESEEAALTQHQVLSVDDSECIVASSNVVLSFGTENQSSFFLVL